MIRTRARWEVWRSPAGQPAWARPVLLAVTTVTVLTYAWRTASQQPEVYYAGAVRSMAGSWHDFFFAAVDPRATISLDKLPGALWLQALSVRAFGVHLWALNLPQIVEGGLTSLVLFRAVRRLAGVPAATIAIVGFACTPATVGLNRGNISDSLLILLLVCTVDAVAAAITGGGLRWLALAGVWDGLAFQAKMIQAWLVLPAVLLAWLIAGPPRLARRVVAGLVMLGLTAVVSLSWMLIVTAVPEHDRPYVDGSNHDSLFAQVFEYNGFSRENGQDFGVVDTDANAAAVQAQNLFQHARIDRTLAGPGGRAIGYLIPIVTVGALFCLVVTRRRPRGDPMRAATVIWAGWLLVDAAAFTVAHRINAYYLAALTPPIVALLAVSAVTLVRWGRSRRRVGLISATVALASVGYAAWLLSPAPVGVRVTVGILGAAGAIAAMLLRARMAAATACVAVLVVPVFAVGALLHAQGGPFVTPYQPAAQLTLAQRGVAASIEDARLSMQGILAADGGDTYPVTTYTAYFAALDIYVSGAEVLPIGGFTGSIPSPTLAQLIGLIRIGDVHLVLLLPTADRRAAWIRGHCHQLPTNPGRVTAFYCTPQNAGT